MALAAGVVRLATRPARALLLAAALLGAAHCRQEEAPPPVSKARERTAAAPARRVVALAPNLTEIVFALGAGSSLVGVSEYSDFPEAARSLPRVGGLEVSAERVASLTPDLVLATAEGGNRKGAVSALEASGVPVLVVPGGSLDEVLSGIVLVAGRLGRDAEGERLTASLRQRREAVRRSVAARPRPRAVLLVWPDPPSAAGGGTFLDDVLTEAGAQNLLSGRPGWPVISGEWLATAPIEVAVVPDSAVNRPVFERAFASGALSRGTIRAARLVRVDESSLTRPGPRVFDALEHLARGLSP
ncbi:MAG: helical backbone metal receptor [Acidobacteriota bacterium]|nr:helical backbone metal receptor [Acidobacteriota bacterium]